jgi:hypothetical protein
MRLNVQHRPVEALGLAKAPGLVMPDCIIDAHTGIFTLADSAQGKFYHSAVARPVENNPANASRIQADAVHP